MSSIHNDFGPERMYDNDNSTLAHTLDHEPGDTITVDLLIPKRIHSVIFMNRKNGYHKQYLMRLHNVKVTVINTNDEAILCGYTAVVHQVGAEIIQVRCQDTSFATKQILITVDPSKNSLSIAELRFCSIPDPVGKLEVI